MMTDYFPNMLFVNNYTWSNKELNKPKPHAKFTSFPLAYEAVQRKRA